MSSILFCFEGNIYYAKHNVIFHNNSTSHGALELDNMGYPPPLLCLCVCPYPLYLVADYDCDDTDGEVNEVLFFF